MNKLFLEAFPALTQDSDIRTCFEHVIIEKITSTRKQDFIRIYITSDMLIEKPAIYKAENEIKKQLFSGVTVTVKIYEKFVLSSQYTPGYLFELYQDSIFLELKAYDPVEYTLIRKADFTFEGEDQVVICLEDSVVAKKKAADIIRVLEKIFNDRCGLNATIKVTYKAVESEREKKDLTEELAQVAARLEEAAEKKEKEPEPRTKEKPEPKKQAKGTWSGKSSYQKGAFMRKKLPDDPNLIYGRNFDEDTTPIENIVGEMGEVTIRGKVLSYENKPYKQNERAILMFTVSDFTDSIKVKIFVPGEKVPELEKNIKVGAFLKIKGMALIDKFDHEVSMQSVVGIKTIPDFTEKRMDNSPQKRVELHCHTKMSDMDGVSSAGDIVAQAYAWGMPGIAITDHGVVQGLTEAYHYIQKYKGKHKDSDIDKFKVIPAVEGYLVDDSYKIVLNNKGQQLKDVEIVVFDIETTDLSPVRGKIIEIGAVKIKDGAVIDRFSEFIDPKMPIPPETTRLTSITDDMVIGAPTIEVVLPRFVDFCGDCVLVGHNVSFDISFINENCRRQGIDKEFTCIDTMGLSRAFFPGQAKHNLDAVCKKLEVVNEHHHRAIADAECTAQIYLKFQDMLFEKEIFDLEAIKVLENWDPEVVKRLFSYHVVILATDVVGRTNLYTLISKSHLDYFYRKPIIPKSLLMEYREQLIVGSACCAGELYEALLEGKTADEIARIVNFYDYLEIQPIANNQFMIASQKDKYSHITSEEDLRDINREIVALGKKFNKPVVATCDVHFLNPEDEIYRRVIMKMKGMDDEEPAPLYLRTTEEMLKEFDYLGEEKAREVVIENSNKIFDMCNNIAPVRPDKCPPVIENSDETLRKICYDKIHELYGEHLPQIVEERLEKELKSIIGNGYAVLYIIAQKLVWKSLEDGYLVGSRGSVGSSFVAFAAGITEVNSLPPHYLCPECKYSDFDSEDVKKYAGNSGCDMPDKVCPKCGALMKKEGFDIPFETFLGFKGDKEPDIDLNFSGEYQAKAHKYTEVIFGDGQTFRAGTIASVAEKTAYGYVKKYFELENIHKRNAEIERLAEGCIGVRRGTGQHPGGIIVLPVGENIHSFTPIQHPANDMTTPIITTHFDYHSIDHNLLKLDILGHDDPTMIRFLNDCTGEDPQLVPLDDKKVMSLFMNTEALGITPEQISGTKLGCLGLPEFGTDFAMQMVIDAQPQSFSDLIRISGLSHGTDVWLGNAKDLIEAGTATLSSCICCRDDIMVYLIQMGLDKPEAFSIMEQVRKGNVAQGKAPKWEEWKKDMIDHGVPDWYIESCQKIQYMFPKAHAAAYVMMAWRIAYFKIYMPQAFYAAWFSIRAKALNYERMFQGLSTLRRYMAEYRAKGDDLSATEKDELVAMRLAEEMYVRGIEVEPIDIYRADSKSFRVFGNKIMPSLVSLDRLGEKAADQIVEAAKEGPFTSRNDFRSRTKCPQVVIDNMQRLGLFGDLPESSQLSIFDLMGKQ